MSHHAACPCGPMCCCAATQSSKLKAILSHSREMHRVPACCAPGPPPSYEHCAQNHQQRSATINNRPSWLTCSSSPKTSAPHANSQSWFSPIAECRARCRCTSSHIAETDRQLPSRTPRKIQNTTWRATYSSACKSATPPPGGGEQRLAHSLMVICDEGQWVIPLR